MEKTLTIQIVGWNSATELPKALSQLASYPDDITIRYIDNNSSDESVETVKQMLPKADIICLDRNTGFGAAHNIGFKQCATELVLLHNPDLVLAKESLSMLRAAFDDGKVGAVQGKLLKGKNSQGQDIIDSTGIAMTWTLNGKEIGEGEIDTGQYQQSRELAAVTGAAGCFRMAALRDVRGNDGQIFDEDFFAYKEDVDLGWRLRKAGWLCKYVAVTQGVHARGFGKITAANWREGIVLLIKKLRDKRTRYGLRNWLWMMLKNASVKDALRHEIFVDIRLLGFVVLGAVYWPLLATLVETVMGIPKIMNKRINWRQNNHEEDR